tara:strand:- start:3123 stop:3686 length:564 start_codon:yes stop_codon:yes gene_type:complete
MSILVSTAAEAAEGFTPSWLEGNAEPPRFFLRAGSVIEREMMEAELAGEYQAGGVWPWDLHAAVLNGIRTLLGEDGAQLTAIAEADFGGTLESAEERAQLVEVKRILALHWPEYQHLQAQMERRNAVLPVLAFRRYCVRWDNLPFSYATDMDRFVSKVVLPQIDPLQLRAAGLRAYALQYAAGAEKN